MQEPDAVDSADAPQSPAESTRVDLNPGSIEELGQMAEVDSELRSLVDGIAMLSRFEDQLAAFESTLGQAVARGS